MKRIITLFLVLVLGVSLLVGCSGDNSSSDSNNSAPSQTSTPEPVVTEPEPVVAEEVKSNVAENDYVSVTFTEGWEVNETRTTGNRIVLEKADSEEFFKPELIFFIHNTYSPMSKIEDTEKAFPDGNRIDNVVVGGIDYLAHRRYNGSIGPYTYLCTSLEETLNEDEKGALTIDVNHIEIEDVTPILETITIKPQQ